jgi:hypothetical protein
MIWIMEVQDQGLTGSIVDHHQDRGLTGANGHQDLVEVQDYRIIRIEEVQDRGLTAEGTMRVQDTILVIRR